MPSDDALPSVPATDRAMTSAAASTHGSAVRQDRTGVDHGASSGTRPYETLQSSDLVAMSFPGARCIAGWLFWVVFPALCVLSLWLSASAIAHHIGSKQPGVRGSYVAHRICSRNICLVGGTFTSEDGRLVVTSLLGDPRWAEGSRHTVYYDGRSAEVVGPRSWDPTAAALAGLGALTYLSVVGYLLYVEARRGRTNSTRDTSGTRRRPSNTRRRPSGGRGRQRS